MNVGELQKALDGVDPHTTVRMVFIEGLKKYPYETTGVEKFPVKDAHGKFSQTFSIITELKQS
jgi:hypothetical protein